MSDDYDDEDMGEECESEGGMEVVVLEADEAVP